MKKQIFLPERMNTAILAGAQEVYHSRKPNKKISLDRVFKCTDRIVGLYRNKQVPFDEPIQIPRNWFRTILGGQYYEVVNVLLDLKVLRLVQKGKAPYNGLPGFASWFMLNLDFFEGNICIAEYNAYKRKTASSDYIESKAKEFLQQVSWQDDSRQYWKVNEDQASGELYRRDHAREAGDFINEYALENDLYGTIERRITTNEGITLQPDEKINIIAVRAGIELPVSRKTGKFKKITFEKALSIAKENDLDLIEYRHKGKRKYYLKSAQEFISDRYDSITTAWCLSVADVKLLSEAHLDHIRATRNDTNRRIDTAISNLKSEFCEHLRIDGEKLIQLDLQSSQLTILANVTNLGLKYIEHIRKNFMRKPQTKITSQLHLFSKIKTQEHIQIHLYQEYIKWIYDYSYTKLWHKVEKTKSQQVTPKLPKIGEILPFWYKDVTTGDSYRNLAAMMHDKEVLHVTDQERKTAKIAYFRVLFDSYKYSFPEKDAIREAYPGLIEFLDGFKEHIFYKRSDYLQKFPERYKEKYGTKIPYQLAKAVLPCMLQQLESRIFIDGIFYELCKKGIPVLTKHDSILCKESDLCEVQNIMHKHLNRSLDAYQLK